MTSCPQHEALRRAIDVIVSKTANSSSSAGALLLTGAGISTASGLPDYRSPIHGLYNRGHRPITIQQFLSSEHQQRRYFARSFFGYRDMQNASVNVCHTAIGKMLLQQQESTTNQLISHCITQNVDGLLHAAIPQSPPTLKNPNPKTFMKSDSRVEHLITELHGSIHYVVCMKCGEREHRNHLQNRMLLANGEWAKKLAPGKMRDNDPNTPAVRSSSSSSTTMKVVKMETYSSSVNRTSSSSSVSEKIIEREVKKTSSSSSSVIKNENNDDDDYDASINNNNRNTTINNDKARPDGDFFLTDEDIDGFELPHCLNCERNKIHEGKGLLRPHVVLFGDSIPAAVKTRAHQIAEESPVLICAGTSLQVPSAFTFVRNFLQSKKPVIILNDGPTRLDEELEKNKEATNNKSSSSGFSLSSSNSDLSKLIIKVPGRLEQSLCHLALCLPTR